MEFHFNNMQELFYCVNELNQKYYIPADENFKLYEEYSRDNAAFLLEQFRDAHDCLVKAIMVKNVDTRKDAIVYYLEKYVKILLIILIREYTALITVRKDDLISAPFCHDDKKSIQEKLSPIWDKLRTFTSVKFTYKNTIEELITAKDFYKENYEFIEDIYKNYNLV